MSTSLTQLPMPDTQRKKKTFVDSREVHCIFTTSNRLIFSRTLTCCIKEALSLAALIADAQEQQSSKKTERIKARIDKSKTHKTRSRLVHYKSCRFATFEFSLTGVLSSRKNEKRHWLLRRTERGGKRPSLEKVGQRLDRKPRRRGLI